MRIFLVRTLSDVIIGLCSFREISVKYGVERDVESSWPLAQSIGEIRELRAALVAGSGLTIHLDQSNNNFQTAILNWVKI